MRLRGSWLVLAGLIGVAAVLLAITQAGPADSPEHSSSSDGRNGTSALKQFATALGRPGMVRPAAWHVCAARLRRVCASVR